MDRGRVGDERGSKEMDGCPLTKTRSSQLSSHISVTLFILTFIYCHYLCQKLSTFASIQHPYSHPSPSRLSHHHPYHPCKGITQTLIPDTLAVKPKASQSTDGNLLWCVVYISDTACLRMGTADDTQPALADPHPLRRPWPVTGRYAAGVP
jgi:hypothetical protein